VPHSTVVVYTVDYVQVSPQVGTLVLALSQKSVVLDSVQRIREGSRLGVVDSKEHWFPKELSLCEEDSND